MSLQDCGIHCNSKPKSVVLQIVVCLPLRPQLEYLLASSHLTWGIMEYNIQTCNTCETYNNYYDIIIYQNTVMLKLNLFLTFQRVTSLINTWTICSNTGVQHCPWFLDTAYLYLFPNFSKTGPHLALWFSRYALYVKQVARQSCDFHCLSWICTILHTTGSNMIHV